MTSSLLAQGPQVADVYIPADAFAGVVIHPKAFFAEEQAELIPHEVLTAMSMENFGIDPTDIEQIVAITASRGTLQEIPFYGAIVRFANPYKLPESFGDMFANTPLDGGRVYEIEGVQLFALNDKTMIISDGVYLRKMIEAKDTKSPLVKMFASQPPNAHVNVYANIEQVKDQLNALAEEAPALPPAFAPLLETPSLVKQLNLAISIKDLGVPKIGFKAVAYNEGSATKFAQNLEIATGAGKEMVLQQMVNELDPEDKIQAATAKYIKRVLNQAEGKLKPKQDGDDVYVILDDPIASVGAVSALLLPAVQTARSAARRSSSQNNMKQIALAIHNYHDTFRAMPADIVDKDDKPILSWRVAILPFIEHDNLYNQFNMNEPWDSEHNIKLSQQVLEVYRHPGDSKPSNRTCYLRPTGPGCGNEPLKWLRFRDFTDGTSNTILVVEVDEAHTVPWAKPVDLPFDPAKPDAGIGIGKRIEGGFQAAFTDASVQIIPASVDKETLKNLMLRNDGKRVDF